MFIIILLTQNKETICETLYKVGDFLFKLNFLNPTVIQLVTKGHNMHIMKETRVFIK